MNTLHLQSSLHSILKNMNQQITYGCTITFLAIKQQNIPVYAREACSTKHHMKLKSALNCTADRSIQVNIFQPSTYLAKEHP